MYLDDPFLHMCLISRPKDEAADHGCDGMGRPEELGGNLLLCFPKDFIGVVSFSNAPCISYTTFPSFFFNFCK